MVKATHPSYIRMTGPLALYREKLRAHLLAQGYTRHSCTSMLCVLGHFSRWLLHHGIDPADLSADRIDEYLGQRREAGYACWYSHRGLDPIIEFLQSEGAVSVIPADPADPEPHAELIDQYETYLVCERSLTRQVVASPYLGVAREFLSTCNGGGALRLDRLCTGDITSFVVRDVRRSTTGYAQTRISALRSFLRFLHVQGLVAEDLARAVPPVARRRNAGFPKSPPPDVVRRLLRCCDRRTRAGRRDCAVILLLGRMGLRAGEVANLRLEDVRWAQGELIVRGKPGRCDRLPLPQDVGEALAAYVRRGRPRTPSRRFFVLVRAPYSAISREIVSAIVRRACARCGIAPFGAHRLRHYTATEMLRHGADLAQIAQVLRHRSLNTTAIYAKVDRDALRPLGRPWPGGVA